MPLPKRKPTAATAKTAAAPTVKLGEGLADAPQTFLPGEYKIVVKDAEPRVSKKGTLSLILTAIEAESEMQVNLPPIWMGGGNTANAPTLAENHEAIQYMVEAAGGKPKGLEMQAICDTLTGAEMWIELAEDQINGRTCNRIVNACSLAEYEAS